MRVHLCGVRGSMPAPGPGSVRYGGHTSCVAVAADEGPPRLVLDAGTGLTNLTAALGGEPFSGAILLGHIHWDHVVGLPFFRGGDRDGATVDLYLPDQGEDAEQILRRIMSPPTFPIAPDQLRGAWTFRTIGEGERTIAGFSVLAREIPHKGGRTFGYRISDGERSLAYLSDHHPRSLGEGPDGHGPYHEAALDLAEGVDLLIHDAQYTAEEFPSRADFGHCTIDYALGLAERCDVGRLLLFHHDPTRTDDELDAIVAGLPPGRSVSAAIEGEVINL